MSPPRLFLVAPEISADKAIACLKAACAAGDVASLLLPPSLARAVTPEAQSLGVAVLTTGEARDALRAGCDGLQVEAGDPQLPDLRAAIGKDRILGVFAGASRHAAMEASEAGADYVALSQRGASIGGEPIVKWWAEMMEVPCVAFDPVTVEGLDTLLPQKPDFIRPDDAMWESPEAARCAIADIAQYLESR